MHEDYVTIRIPKFTGYKTIAFNAAVVAGAACHMLLIPANWVPSLIVVGIGLANIGLRFVSSGLALASDAASERPAAPGNGSGGGGTAQAPRRVGASIERTRPIPVPDISAKYARATVAPTAMFKPNTRTIDALKLDRAVTPAHALPYWGYDNLAAELDRVALDPIPAFFTRMPPPRPQAERAERRTLHSGFIASLGLALSGMPLGAYS